MILNSLHIKELEYINSIIFQAVGVGNPLIYLLIDRSSLYGSCVVFPGLLQGIDSISLMPSYYSTGFGKFNFVAYTIPLSETCRRRRAHIDPAGVTEVLNKGFSKLPELGFF
jgi:hypothetical protein